LSWSETLAYTVHTNKQIDFLQTLAASRGSDHPLVIIELDDKHMSLA